MMAAGDAKSLSSLTTYYSRAMWVPEGVMTSCWWLSSRRAS